MIKIIFNNSKKIYDAEFQRIKRSEAADIIQLKGVPNNISGFCVYSERDVENPIGEYQGYTTIYKAIDDGYQFSNDGSIYQEPNSEPTQEPIDPEKEEVLERKREIEKKQSEINNLKIQLDSTDYKIVKAYEYESVGIEVEYNMKELHKNRQFLRDEINKIENEIKELEERI